MLQRRTRPSGFNKKISHLSQSASSQTHTTKQQNGINLSFPLTNSNILQLQKTIGNRAVVQLLKNSRQQVMQLALEKKLNVAGEIHDESGKERKEEMEFLKEKTGSTNYWREHEFRIRQNDKKSPAADSLLLQMLQRTVQMINILNKVIVQPNKQVWEALRTHFHHEIDQLDITLEYFTKGKEFVSSEEEGLLQTIQEPFKEFRETWSDFFNKDHTTVGVAEIQSSKCTLIQIHNTLSNGRQYSTSDDVSKYRSDKMHEAAKEQSTVVGLWKIGDQHVKDILTKFPDEINYNLLERDEFRQEFEQWKAEKQKNRCNIF